MQATCHLRGPRQWPPRFIVEKSSSNRVQSTMLDRIRGPGGAGQSATPTLIFAAMAFARVTRSVTSSPGSPWVTATAMRR